MKTNRAGILIIKNGNLLTMYRKTTREYYCIPGGHIEAGETPEETAVRELKEETTLNVELGDLFCELENQGRTEYYFLAKSFTGDPHLSGPEAERNRSNNVFKIKWVDLSDIPNLQLYPTEIKEKIVKQLCNN
jgi:ADP-ribose pyrophosphatase YjhB (NUDIX family)